MAFTNIFASAANTKPADPQLDSASSTPPSSQTPVGTGAQTPQPNTSDRRFPSILSNYLTQVRDSFHPITSTSTSTNFPAPPAADMEREDMSPPSLNSMMLSDDTTPGFAASAPPTPISPTSGAEGDEMPPLLPHEFFDPPPPRKEEARAPNVHRQHVYPTPPLSSSSSSSFLNRSANIERSQLSASASPEPPLSGTQSPRRRPSAIDGLPVSIRRTTFSAPPVTKIDTPGVAPALISNPGLVLSPPKPLAPSVTRHSACPQLSTASQASEVRWLTEDATLSRAQTPPQTPRTLSSSENKAPAQTSAPTLTTAHPPPPQHVESKSRRASAAGAPVGELKGKLNISITEGRGLRPSSDPYVVCQFQYNEYISRGPRNDTGGSAETDGAMERLRKALPMQRTDSNSGRPMAIPMKSRQSSQTSMSSRDVSRGRQVTDPVWNHDATFDVVGNQSEIDISVYDRAQESFLGHIRFCPTLIESDVPFDQWLRLEPRGADEEPTITGEVRLRLSFQKVEKKHYGPEDFQILKLIGKGTFGQVFQVRKRDTQRIYAMKVLSKKVIVQKKEVAHTVGERNILVRTAMADSAFIVGLKFSFQTPTDLYLVTDYMSGGELFWHLQKESRFQEDRAKFYIAELILALEHLHDHDIVYRDLKPENILLDANGHIALCDFGLSKANLTKDDTTNTFCGTTEYLAPEVLLDEQGYTKMVDFWSLGVLVFEMVCGWSPFYAEDTQQMYKNIAFGKVRFPRDALSTEGRNFVKGLLNRNPKHRLGANGDAKELRAHAFFNDINWDALARKNLVPPFKPKLTSETDTSNFDPEFTNALNGASSLNARAAALAAGVNPATTPLSPTMQANFRGFTYVDESALDKQYSYSDDAMDQEEDFKGWEAGPPSPVSARTNRMSGIQSSSGVEEGMFPGDEL